MRCPFLWDPAVLDAVHRAWRLFGRAAFRYNRFFFSDSTVESIRRLIDYKVFGHVEDDEVIIGREDWLFETVDAETGFPYLRDYVSGCPYTEEEMDLIADLLVRRREEYAARGVTYLVAVIPSAYTACGEYLPAYLGDPCENTRLSVLSAEMAERGVSAFLDLSETMNGQSEGIVLYNNTEDSINAYGGFAVYDGILERLAATGTELSRNRLSFDRIEFATHYTEGKSIARRVGLEETISNRTVSLTNQLTDRYTLVGSGESRVYSYMSEGGEGNDCRVVIGLSDEWDRIQLTPYFSATFRTVIYEQGSTWDEETVSAEADVFVRILHEGELDVLLEESRQ